MSKWDIDICPVFLIFSPILIYSQTLVVQLEIKNLNLRFPDRRGGQGDGAHGIMVITRDCGSRNTGSIPVGHPICSSLCFIGYIILNFGFRQRRIRSYDLTIPVGHPKRTCG